MMMGKVMAEGLAIATANHIPITDQLIQRLTKLGNDFAIASEKGQFMQQVFDQTRTPAEQYAATIERLNLAFDNGKTNSDLYARAVAQAQDKFAQANIHAQALGQSLEQTFGQVLDGNIKNANQALKSFIASLLKMEATAGFKALLYGTAAQGGTSSGLLGGLTAGFGKLLGFASGGSFAVPGSGGIDSQLVSFMATPGERVSVTKDGGYPGGGSPVVYNDNRTFNDVTPDLMSKIELRLRAERPKTAKYVMEQMKTQRARDPHFYDAG
jgi:hypothetical protein